MKRFKVGDRVVFNKTTKTGYSSLVKDGLIGTIKDFDDGSYDYYVEFDEYVGGHSCFEKCKDGHGQFLKDDDLVSLYTTQVRTKDDITIKGDDMIDIYIQKNMTKLNKKYEKLIEKAKLSDPRYKIFKECITTLDKLYKEDKVLTSHWAEIALSKDTQDKIDALLQKHTAEQMRLEDLVKEVNAQLSMCETYGQKQVILKRYNIINENGKVNG